MSKTRVIDKSIIKNIDPHSPMAKKTIPLKTLFKKELDNLQVPYTDNCCSEDPDFEIVVFPDTQNMIRWNNAASLSMSQWVADNKETSNIKALLHVGDIVDLSTLTEFQTADTQFKIFENTGLPVLYTAGNHDYAGWNIQARDLTLFNTYFGPSRYAGKPYYISSVTNTRGESSAIQFLAGKQKFVAISLELFPRQDTLDWAGGILAGLEANEPDTKVIIVTHGYVNVWGEIADHAALYSTDNYGVTNGLAPLDLYNNFIKNYSNIRFVINGHFLTDPNSNAMRGLVEHTESLGNFGNVIHNIFVNYQDDNRTGVIDGIDFTPGGTGGNGFLMRMQFSPKNKTVSFKFYSPKIDIYDPLQTGFTLSYGEGNVEDIDTLAIEKSLQVAGETRFQGKVSFESLTKGRIPFIGHDFKLNTTDDLQYNEVTRGITLGALYIPRANDPRASTSNIGSSGTSPYFGVGALGSEDVIRLTNNWFQNCAMGYWAMRLSNGATNNTAIGSFCMGALVTGDSNTAVGRDCLGKLNGANNNTAIGLVTGYDLTTGSNNVLVGRRTGRGIVTGSNNIIIGDAIQGLSAALSNATMVGEGHSRDNVAKFGKASQTFNIGCTVSEYADNAAALTAGLVAGDVYRTGDLLKIVH